jgi:uncharacterized membrane protein YdjX (TVP38/TMEM64 family)
VKRYALTALGLAVAFLVIYAIASLAGLVIEDPTPLLVAGGVTAAVVSIALLTVDVFAPIPSSLVMLANGLIFGPWLGSGISIAGGVAAFCLAFAVGRGGSGVVRDVAGAREYHRSHALLDRHGALAVSVSRPIPIIAETVAILAGASRMPWTRAVLAAGIGVAPQAIVFALVGSTFSTMTAEAGVVAFIAVISISVLAWVAVPKLVSWRTSAATPSLR